MILPDSCAWKKIFRFSITFFSNQFNVVLSYILFDGGGRSTFLILIYESISLWKIKVGQKAAWFWLTHAWKKIFRFSNVYNFWILHPIWMKFSIVYQSGPSLHFFDKTIPFIYLIWSLWSLIFPLSLIIPMKPNFAIEKWVAKKRILV